MLEEKLTHKKCTACHSDTPRLSDLEADQLLRKLQGWNIIEDGGVKKLTKNCSTEDFAQAMKLANQIANIAEAEAHHPDLLVRWGSLAIMLYTHAVQGLSENDFILAAKIDGIQ